MKVMTNTLYEGTRNKLAYAITKLKNALDAFYLDDIKTEFTPDFDACESLEHDLFRLEEIVYMSTDLRAEDWKLVSKYTKIADEFRASR